MLINNGYITSYVLKFNKLLTVNVIPFRFCTALFMPEIIKTLWNNGE